MNMARTTATFSVSLPPEMAEELERVRKAEHRTRSELVREALRAYIRLADRHYLAERMASLPEDAAMPDEVDALNEGSADFREGRHMTLDQLRYAIRRPSR
jgi:CopG family transcriptional regulator/antitoxin EndoAI